MTIGLSAVRKVALGRELHLEPGQFRAILLALAATLAVVWLFSPAAPLHRYLTTAATASNTVEDAVVSAVVAPVEAVPTAAPAAAGNKAEIDTLAGVIAKRYRVAPEATRGMLATAYGEGSRVGLDPLLIVAVIAVESRFNPIAASEMGAQGLMQIIPGYHKDRLPGLTADSFLDPQANIRLGALLLKEYIQRGGSEIAGLQLYVGAAEDANATYAGKVLAEKQRLMQTVQRLRDRLRV